MNFIDNTAYRASSYVVKSNKFSRYYISLFFASVFLIFAISGNTAENSIFISMALCIIWITTAYFTNINLFLATISTKNFLMLVVFLVVYSVQSFFTAGLYNTLKYIGAFIISFSPMLILSYYEKVRDGKLLKYIITTTLAAWFFFCIRALLFYYENPGAARKLASNENAFGNLSIGGGYPLAFGSAILGVFLFDILIRKTISNLKIKFCLIMSIIVLTLVVFETRSTITFIGYIFGVIVVILIRIHTNSKAKINYSLFSSLSLVSLIIFTLIYYIENIGLTILRFTYGSNNVLLNRLYEVGLQLAYSDSGGSDYLKGRLSLVAASFNHFLNSPLIGNGYLYGFDFLAGKEFGIGNHGQWFDVLAVYGLLGGVPYFLIYYFAIRSSQQFNNNFSTRGYIFVMIFLGLFNPFKTIHPHIIIFLVIPAIYLLLTKYQNNEVLKC
jgi:hypothetical protein